jgi:hypothetical protein
MQKVGFTKSAAFQHWMSMRLVGAIELIASSYLPPPLNDDDEEEEWRKRN